MVDYSFPKGSVPAGTKFWAFPLDENGEDPPVRILLVGEDKNYIFPGEAVESLVRAAKNAFKPLKTTKQAGKGTVKITYEDGFPPEPIPDKQPSAQKTEGGLLALARKHSQDDEKGLVSFLSGILEKNGSIQGLVFEGYADVSRIHGRVSAFADIIELKTGRCLIVGDRSMDCELLSHRLSASLSGKSLVWFSAKNPQEALGALKAYL
jgi:hypothetical protein